MVSYDDKRNLCRDSYTVARLIEQSIFNQITPETTQQQFAAAQESLRRLCQRFGNNLDLFHCAAISGSHHCVRDVYEDARARLENLAIMQPPPAPPPPQLISREGIVIAREEKSKPAQRKQTWGQKAAPLTTGTLDDACPIQPNREKTAGTLLPLPRQPQYGHLCPCRQGDREK